MRSGEIVTNLRHSGYGKPELQTMRFQAGTWERRGILLSLSLIVGYYMLYARYPLVIICYSLFVAVYACDLRLELLQSFYRL